MLRTTSSDDFPKRLHQPGGRAPINNATASQSSAGLPVSVNQPASVKEFSGRRAASCLLALNGEKEKRFGASIYWLFANLRRRGLAHEVPGAGRG